MKSYEEVTRDLLKRRNEYEQAQTKRQRNALRVAVPVCSVALAAVAGVGIWKSGVLEKLPISAGQFVSPDDPNTKDRIVINEANGVNNYSLDIDFREENFIEMTYDEMTEYYGAEIKPDVPENLKLEDERHGILKRDGGTGEVYFDTNCFRYSDEDISREVNVNAAKGRLPVTDCVYFSNSNEKSYIQDVEIKIVRIGSKAYSAEFMVSDVGFRIHARGLSDEEFVAVVASIIEKNK